MQVLRFARKGLAQARFTPLQSARMSSGKDFFDYEFERKLDRGNFPHPHINFTKVLDDELDTTSSQYLENYDAMQNLNYELDEKVAEVMKISLKEADKLKERGKLTARERITQIIDRGSPFLEIG